MSISRNACWRVVLLAGFFAGAGSNAHGQVLASYGAGGYSYRASGFGMGPTYFGPGVGGFWSYNVSSPFWGGGLNWYHGPAGGYTPYVTPYGNYSFGYPNFGPYYNYVPLAPSIVSTPPAWNGIDAVGLGLADPVVANPRADRQGVGLAKKNVPQRLPAQPRQEDPPIIPKEGGKDAFSQSERLQRLGDEYFAKQEYLTAVATYKRALGLAPRRIEPRFRMAMALAASTNYTLAIDEIKRAMRAEPDWPSHGASLDELFGPNNTLSKNAILHRLALWVKDDIRDPERLFLMGVFMHFNDDPEKSIPFLEAAAALSPSPMYANAFLDVARQNNQLPAPRPQPGLREGDEAVRAEPERGPLIPGLKDEPKGAPRARLQKVEPNKPDPVFRGKKSAPEEPRPKPLAMRFERMSNLAIEPELVAGRAVDSPRCGDCV